MKYEVVMTDQALASLARLSPEVARRIVRKIERMSDSLAGDVKRLVQFEPA